MRGAVWLAALALATAGAGCATDTPNAGPAAPEGGAGRTPSLRGAPLLFAPTANGFGVSVVLEAGEPANLGVRIRADDAADWTDVLSPDVRAPDLAQWRVAGLTAGTRYRYQILARDAEAVLYEGTVMTQRPPGASFSFAMVSDTHVGAESTFTNQGVPATLSAASVAIGAAAPDFMVNLGDVLDFHQYGFNEPPPDTSIARAAYLNYRSLLADTTANAAHYEVLGGWDSEAGCDTPDEVDRSRSQRLLYVPGPDPATYPEGGSTFENYYAFTWGDALFVMLDVFGTRPPATCSAWAPGSPTTGRSARRSSTGCAACSRTRPPSGASSSSTTRWVGWPAIRSSPPTGAAAAKPPTSASRRSSIN